MKSSTILDRIKHDQTCSIHTIELLNKALKREGKLNEAQSIRFRFLYGDFDIVNADYMQNGVKASYHAPMNIETLSNMFESKEG